MKYEVLPGRSVVTDKTYLPGQQVELNEEEAERLQKRGIVGGEIKEKAEPPKQLNVGDTVKLIEAVESVEALEPFATDKRKGVVDALQKRQEELSK